MDKIALTDVTVARGRRRVLQGISHEFGPGVTALLGNNGSGKSTLMETMLGLLPRDGGTVTIGGQAIGTRMVDRSVFANIGWMPQDPGFTQGVRAIDVVTYAAWLRGVEEHAREAARAALTTVNLVHLDSRPSHHLSGGERRRLGLACTLVGDPQFLLLDEPTAGLDVAQREGLLEVVRTLSPHHTIVLSTHLIEDVIAVADHLLVIDGGRVTQRLAMPQGTTGDRTDRMDFVRDLLLGRA